MCQKVDPFVRQVFTYEGEETCNFWGEFAAKKDPQTFALVYVTFYSGLGCYGNFSNFQKVLPIPLPPVKNEQFLKLRESAIQLLHIMSSIQVCSHNNIFNQILNMDI